MVKSWWNGNPTATVTFKDFILGRDELDAGGYAYQNDPHSAIVYKGLSSDPNPNISIPKWLYLNAALHEVGHAVFGFGHPKGNSVMWHKTAYKRPVGFNQVQRRIVINSKWGY